MKALNKQALRSKARSASAGEWIKESDDGWEAISSADDQANGNFIIAHFEGPDAQANREFAQAANPDTVLALLDELEAVQKTSAARLEAIDRIHKMYQRERDRADAAEKRIAELEARKFKVEMPESFYPDGDIEAPLVLQEHEVIAAIVAAEGMPIAICRRCKSELDLSHRPDGSHYCHAPSAGIGVKGG